ncbi:MAG: polymerase subunit gamma and tau, partial [Nocardioides sp.]|nr:polymerase subunit gamma and tau [Nocardioides sp.]
PAPPVATPAPERAPQPAEAAQQEAQPPAAPEPTTAPAGLTLVDVRRLWPDIVEATKLRRRVAWMHLSQNAQVISVEANVLTLGFANSGARDSFVSGGCDEVLRQAAIDVVGADWKIETIVDPSAQAPGPVVTVASTRPTPGPAATPAAAATVSEEPARPEVDSPPAWAAEGDLERADDVEVAATQAPDPAPPADPQSIAAARGAIKQTRGSGEQKPRSDSAAAADADAHPDDPDADPEDLGADALLSRELGAEMIEEIRHP